MGTDWISIEVQDTKADDIELFLRNNIQLPNIDKDILEFDNSNVNVFFYKDSDQHFDFDPRDIKTINQWEQFLEIFKRISKTFKKNVLFRPEDNNGDLDSVLVRLTDDQVDYNFKVRDNYKE